MNAATAPAPLSLRDELQGLADSLPRRQQPRSQIKAASPAPAAYSYQPSSTCSLCGDPSHAQVCSHCASSMGRTL